ncbi:hypothetical protein ACGWYM_002394 [Enterococcus hirae]|nr:hypothetical protein [Enterococcus hirae]
MKPSERWKAINEKYGGEMIREPHHGKGVITNHQEVALNIPKEWAAKQNREKLLEVIHNFEFLWEREGLGLKEVPPATREETMGKKSVSIFLPAAEIAQLKADIKKCKQSFSRKGVVLSYLLQKLDPNAPILPPKMELGTTNLYPPELVEFAKRLAEIPLEEQELYSAEFEDFKAKCKEIYVSPHTLLQKCRQGKL